jgi:hypothetical protein
VQIVHRRTLVEFREEDRTTAGFVELCHGGHLSKCIECTGEELYLEFSEKTELLKTLGGLCQEGIELVQECTERTLLSSGMARSVQGTGPSQGC